MYFLNAVCSHRYIINVIGVNTIKCNLAASVTDSFPVVKI